jgi:hypothetical protein
MTRKVLGWRILLAVTLLAVALAVTLSCSQTTATDQPADSETTMTVEMTETVAETTMTAEETRTAAEEKKEEPAPKGPTKQLGTGSLWKYIQSEDYEKSWPVAPGFDKPQKGFSGAHLTTIKIWVNDVADAALNSEPPPGKYPQGSIIVKEGYRKNGSLGIVAVMHKQGDGKWNYAEYRADGSVIGAGVETPGCADCHSEGQDFVRAFKLRP